MAESPNKETHTNQASDDVDEMTLETVAISDADLETADSQKSSAKKLAKKRAKSLRSSDEKKQFKRRQLLIVTGVVLLTLVLLFAIPKTRWPILSTLGLKGTLSLTVQTDEGGEPVEGVVVQLDKRLYETTDAFGRVTFHNAPLGPKTISLAKPGYSNEQVQVTVGLGTTQPDPAFIKVIGIALDFHLKHWLSGDAIEGGEVTFKEASAKSDQDGLATLVVPPNQKSKIEVTVAAKGYVTKKLTTDTNVASREVSLVADSQDYFISKRSGKFDIYRANLDGSKIKKIIEATGKEEAGLLQFTIHSGNRFGLLVATREGKIVDDRLIAGVYVVDLEQAKLTKVDEGSDIQVLDWSKDEIIYTKGSANLSYEDKNFTKIMAYNVVSSNLRQLVQANYFAANLVAEDTLFYQAADASRVLKNANLTGLNLSTNQSQAYAVGKQVAYLTRAAYESLSIMLNDNKYYTLSVFGGQLQATDRRPVDRLHFAVQPKTKQIIWTDRRDGKGVLLHKKAATASEKLVASSAGITEPVRWLGESLAVVRVATNQETADYIVHVPSGKLSKIADVTNIGNLSYNGF